MSTPPAPLKVLFVCTANICRSAYMEFRARQLAGDDSGLVFSSAGTHAPDGLPMDGVMASTLDQPVDGFTSRRLTRELVEQADLILTAEAANRTVLLEEFPGAFRRVFVLGQFAALVDQFDGLRGRDLVAAAGTRLPVTMSAYDVADPYGRGIAASQTAAEEISGLLARVLPAMGEGST